MENSIGENDPQVSFRSPPKRRRSTFFERRESIVPGAVSENIDRNVNKLRQVDENQNLLKYHDLLLAEKEQWKKEVISRRSKYHDIRQQYEMAVKAPSRSRISYSVLTNDDIDFFKAKVNISKVIDSQQKLHKSVKETHALYVKANELDNVILDYCQDKVNIVKDYILDNSTIEPK